MLYKEKLRSTTRSLVSFRCDNRSKRYFTGKSILEATDVTGIVLTKMDGTAKGGVVLAIRDLLHLPVRFLGLGEKPADLRPFDINAFLMGITKGMEE